MHRHAGTSREVLVLHQAINELRRMLKPGNPAPALVLNDQHGQPFDLAAAWSKQHVVLFFYPKAHTSVCTQEACAFRDAYADLQARNAVVIGISRDGSASQQSFASRWNLPFTLLADVDGKARKAYEVDSFFGLIPGRITYVIGQGGIIRHAHSDLFASHEHVQQALSALDDQRTV